MCNFPLSLGGGAFGRGRDGIVYFDPRLVTARANRIFQQGKIPIRYVFYFLKFVI